jgi:predicted Zn-dependent protease
MKFKATILCVFCLLTVVACINENPSEGKRQNAGLSDRTPLLQGNSRDSLIYDFPNKVECSSDFSEQCFSSPEEYAVYAAAKVEEGARSGVKIDVKTENEVGDKFHKEQGFTFIEDSSTVRLRNILKKMLPHVNRTELKYQVYLVSDSEINAWTVPGGNIYFTTGILKFVQSDDEIANILGHEIGHNECRHTLKMLQRLAIAQMPQQALKDFFGIDVPVNVETLVGLMSVGTIVFGQHEELESDRTGMQLSSLAGYNPEKGLDFWKRMSAKEKENKFEKMFRSHPYSSARYDCGKTFLKNKKKKK